jgi:hypothetical protein
LIEMSLAIPIEPDRGKATSGAHIVDHVGPGGPWLPGARVPEPPSGFTANNGNVGQLEACPIEQEEHDQHDVGALAPSKGVGGRLVEDEAEVDEARLLL